MIGRHREIGGVEDIAQLLKIPTQLASHIDDRERIECRIAGSVTKRLRSWHSRLLGAMGIPAVTIAGRLSSCQHVIRVTGRVRAFSQPHEEHFARSVLEAAGIEVWLLTGIPLFPVLRRRRCADCGYRLKSRRAG